jgi:signal transduction histidine kinase
LTRKTPTDVSGEVARIAAEFRPLAASRRATVCVTARATPAVPMRPDSLRHIVLNLLDNAVKYGPPGQTVNITVDSDNDNVLISVVDEGPGIDVRDRERVWQPFTRGPTAQASGGSGIGLSIVREVAEGHGGSARIQETTRGARFVVTLPINPQPLATV